MKNTGHLWMVLACGFLAIIMIDRFAPVPESPPVCDDVCRAMQYIEAGQDVPGFINFPIYMSRFDMEVVAMNERYQNQLPPNICLGKTAVLISDSVTGYKWLANGRGDSYNVL